MATPVKSGLVKNVKRAIAPFRRKMTIAPPASNVGLLSPVSTTPGDRVTYGGLSGTVDAGGVARIDGSSGGNEYARRAGYQEQMFRFAQAHPELIGQTVNIYEHPFFRDAAGRYVGPIDHPDYQTPVGDGYTGPRNGQFLLNGAQASFGNNESDFRNFFTRQVVAPPAGWQPGQVVTSGAYQQAPAPAAPAVPAPTNPIARGADVGLPATGAPATPAPSNAPASNPVSRGTGVPDLSRDAGNPGILKGGKQPADFGPLTPTPPPQYGPGVRPAEFGPVAPQPPIDKPGILPQQGGGNFGPLPPGGKDGAPVAKPVASNVGLDSYANSGFDVYSREPARSGTATGNFADAVERSQVNDETLGSLGGIGGVRKPIVVRKPITLTPTPTKPAANVGLSAGDSLNGSLSSRAHLFADGGRVRRRRRPVTLEHGYADGGKAGELLTYQDYLNLFNAGQHGSEAGSDAPLTPQQWAGMPQEQRWNLVGGQIPILPGDPRYDALKPRVGGEQGRAIWVRGSAPPANGIVPGAPVERGADGSYVFSEDARTPEWQAQDEGSDLFRTFLIAAAAMVGGAAAMGAFSSGATVGSQMAAGAGQGFGTAMGGGAADILAGTAGASASAAGSAATNTGSSFLDNVAGGLDPTGNAVGPGFESSGGHLTFVEGAPGLSGAEGGAFDFGSLAANPSVQSAAASSGQSVSQWLSNPRNLQTAVRIASTVGSLIAGGSSPGSGQVQPIPGPEGTPIPGGTGTGVTVPGATVAPGGGASSFTEQPLDPAFLASLDPANFQGGAASFDRWAEQRGRFKPLEDMLFDDAMKAGSASEQEAAAGIAGADVEQTFTSAVKQQRDRLIAQGINPDTGSGPGAELDRLAMLDKAKAAAGAKNIARRGEKERGFAARTQAAGVGNAIAGQALSADNIGLQYDQGNRRIALDAAGRRADLGFRAHEGAADRGVRTSESAADREFRSGENAAERTWRSGESAAERELRRQQINAGIEAGNYTRNRQDQQDRGRGIGQAIGTGMDIYRFGRDMDWWGGYADGGRVDASDVGLGTEEEELPPGASKKRRKRRDYRDGARVKGPGTGTSDSIPAMLSNNETVVNVEGTEIIDEMHPGLLDEANAMGMEMRKMRKHMQEQLRDYDPSEVGL